MIVTGQLLLVGDTPEARIEPGWIETDGERIKHCCTGEIRGDADAGDEHTLITPGFYDAHVHLSQFEAIGAFGRTLIDWLHTVVFPSETRWGDHAYSQQKIQHALNNLLRHGTLGFAGYTTVHYAATYSALRETENHNMCARIGQVLMDMECPDELKRPTRQLIQECESLLEHWPSQSDGLDAPRVSASVNPRFALTCSGELMTRAGELAHKHEAYVQTHLAEMTQEYELAKQLHEAEDYTYIYEQAGLLSPRSLFAHGVWLTSDETHRLSESQSTVVHCPNANAFLNSGTMNFHDYQNSGLPLALGSDIGAGYETSMVRNARSMLLNAHYLGTPAYSAEFAWWLITRGNAKYLGWNQCGHLKEQAYADFLMLRPPKFWQHTHDPLGYLLFGWSDKWLTQAFLKGRPVWENEYTI